MDEVKPAIQKCMDNDFSLTGFQDIHEYSTGTDYSYLNVKYFKSLHKDIYTMIQNDTTKEKWVVFVSKESDGI